MHIYFGTIHQTAMLFYIEKKLDERELNCLWRTLEIDLLKTLLMGGIRFFMGT